MKIDTSQKHKIFNWILIAMNFSSIKYLHYQMQCVGLNTCRTLTSEHCPAGSSPVGGADLQGIPQVPEAPPITGAPNHTDICLKIQNQPNSKLVRESLTTLTAMTILQNIYYTPPQKKTLYTQKKLTLWEHPD